MPAPASDAPSVRACRLRWPLEAIEPLLLTVSVAHRSYRRRELR